jgi:hypothetical protein
MNPSVRLRGIMWLLKTGEAALAIESLRLVIERGDEREDIACEVLSLLEAGLTDDAHRRLECWAAPKFKSEAECAKRYAEAIAEKRARSIPLAAE